MTGLTVMALDADLTDHLRVACQVYRLLRRKDNLSAPPPSFDQFEALLTYRAVSNGQKASPTVTDRRSLDDDLRDREFLTRSDVARVAGVSLATVDRWLRNGLRSTLHGRTRRIAKPDLEEWMRRGQ